MLRHHQLPLAVNDGLNIDDGLRRIDTAENRGERNVSCIPPRRKAYKTHWNRSA